MSDSVSEFIEEIQLYKDFLEDINCLANSELFDLKINLVDEDLDYMSLQIALRR